LGPTDFCRAGERSGGRAQRKGPKAGCSSIEKPQAFDGDQMAEVVNGISFKVQAEPVQRDQA
jgi:hypothetical protein